MRAMVTHTDGRRSGSRLPIALIAAVGFAGFAHAEEPDSPRPPVGPYCACWETEPAMDFGGRSVSAIQGGVSGVIGRRPAIQAHPAVAAAWEFPMALALLLVQHEIMGHGGRAREFDLEPDYGIGIDSSAFTTIDEAPESNEQNVLLASGGTESTHVLARRLLLDIYRTDGGDAAQLPLLLFAKLDLTLYVSQTEDPDPPNGDDDFVDQYEDGNDMAIYLVSRQGLRVGADPIEVWERTYTIDYSDPLLDKTFDELRVAAVWNLLDPAVILAAVEYFRAHIGDGAPRIKPPVWQVADGLGLTLGTRAALGVGQISRFLDLYFITSQGLGSFYVRDLDSSADRTHGFGIGFDHLRLGSRSTLGFQGDWWKNPDALELPDDDTGWNLTARIDWMFHRRWGLAAKLGHKSEGWLPGLPSESGTYVGFGVLASF